jgi:hypothetical protein
MKNITTPDQRIHSIVVGSIDVVVQNEERKRRENEANKQIWTENLDEELFSN